MSRFSGKFSMTASILLLAACSGGGGGGGPSSPPTGSETFEAVPGLSAATPSSGTLALYFTPAAAGFEVAVFVSNVEATLFAGAPTVPTAGETRVTLTGLVDGTSYFVGLGVRAVGDVDYTPVGPLITATPGGPIYVDASAPSGGTGATPATAYNSIPTALAAATAAGGGNLWIKAGAYHPTQTLAIAAGVHVYGGFGAAFDADTRDPSADTTVIYAALGADGADLGDQLSNGKTAVLDGVWLLGNRRGSVGVSVDSTDPCDIELRSVIVTDFLDRGVRLRNANDSEKELVIVSSQFSRNGSDGLSGSGAWDVAVHGSLFGENGQEGLEFDPLAPESAGKCTLDIESCQFFANGTEGMDVSLQAPLAAAGGDFSVRVTGCAFEANLLSGCVIDADFDAVPGYSAAIVMRESLARGNGSHGFHVDVDGPSDTSEAVTAFLYRLSSVSNAASGIHVTSETRPGLLTVSTSSMVGNGVGLNVLGPTASVGNYSVTASHCLFAANLDAGMLSRDVPSAANSCIAYQQTNPFDASTLDQDNVITSDPAAIAFVNAPVEFANVLSRSGRNLGLAVPCGFSSSFTVELGDDDVARSVSAISGDALTVTLAEVATSFSVPGVLFAYQPGTSDVGEDYNLDAGTIAVAAGMNGADAGFFGSALPGIPGVADDVRAKLFHVLASSHSSSAVVGATDAITIEFSDDIETASATAATVRAFRGATPIPVLISTTGAELTVTPTVDWGTGEFRLELDGLTDVDGNVLSGAIVLPFSS